MAKAYRPVDREQEFLLPPSMIDWLDDEHLVWFLIEAVKRLDTTRFHRLAKLGGVGRRGYDPDMLLTLFVYAMAHGESSSRRIERLCHTDVAFRVICAQDVPDHTVLARFRKNHEAALTDLLTESLALAAELGMVSLGTVAFDGTKIAGNASRDANRSEAHLRRLAQEFVDTVAKTDHHDDPWHRRRRHPLPEQRPIRQLHRHRPAGRLASASDTAPQHGAANGRIQAADRGVGGEERAYRPKRAVPRRGAVQGSASLASAARSRCLARVRVSGSGSRAVPLAASIEAISSSRLRTASASPTESSRASRAAANSPALSSGPTSVTAGSTSRTRRTSLALIGNWGDSFAHQSSGLRIHTRPRPRRGRGPAPAPSGRGTRRRGGPAGDSSIWR